MARKQSREDQLMRIERLSCPIHGNGIYQYPFWEAGGLFSVGQCTMKGCGVLVVIDDSGEGDRTIRQVVTPEQLGKLEEIWDSGYSVFAKRFRKKIDAELNKFARAPEVQLPIQDR